MFDRPVRSDRGESNYLRGLLHLDGHLHAKNLRKARIHFGKAMNEGHLGAALEYAQMCLNGDGGDRDLTESCRAYQEVAQRYIHCASTNRYKNRISEAFTILGDLYFMGEGTERNYKEALACYLSAEREGAFGREDRIAYMYEHGIGTERDLVSAAIWYQKAAALHNKSVVEACKRIMAQLTVVEKLKVRATVSIHVT